MKKTLQTVNRHVCTIKKNSESCLPKLSPTASKWKKLMRRFRKLLILSKTHPATSQHFRSSAAIMFERKRQISTSPAYIIHPFSKFAYFREIVWFFLYVALFTLCPVTTSLVFYEDVETLTWVIRVTYMINIFILFTIIFGFISGYHHAQVKETVLLPKQIAIHYCKTYFPVDFLCLLPSKYIFFNDIGKIFVIAQHLLLYARVPTMFKFSRHITNLLHVGDTLHEVAVLIALTLLILHWLACVLCIADYYYVLLGDLNESWFRKAKLTDKNVGLTERYLSCLHMTVVHLFRMGSGVYGTESNYDHMTLTLISVFGSAYYGYLVVIILQAIGTANAAESKYEELLRQLYEYLRSKRVPVNINRRLTRYCEYRFQKRYFRTESILSTLSEHLRNEITLYTSRNLIAKVEIFKGLPRGLIGSIIACLTIEVYLTNDVIIMAQVPADYWYIISHGTVALIHIDGIEICHLEDGDVFGSGHLFENLGYPISVVAIEISEVFRMPRKDFLASMKTKSIYDKLLISIEERRNKVKEALSKHDPKQQVREEILYKVRKGTILEGGSERRKLVTNDEYEF